MKIKCKIIRILFFFILSIIGVLFGIALYIYNNPSSIKPFLEKTVSMATNSSFSMNMLSFSISPLSIIAEDIRFSPTNGSDRSILNVPRLTMDFSMKGPLGNRILIIEKLMVHAPSIVLSGRAVLPEINRKQPAKGLIVLFLKKLTGLLLFREIRLNDLEIIDGKVSAVWGDMEIQTSSLKAQFTDKQYLKILCQTRVYWKTSGASLVMQEIGLVSDSAFSFDRPLIQGSLFLNDAEFKHPIVEMREINQKALIHYSPGDKKIEIGSLQLECPRIFLKGKYKTEKPLPKLSFTMTGGQINTEDRSLSLKNYLLSFGAILRSEGGLDLNLEPALDLTLASRKTSLAPDALLPFLPSSLISKSTPFMVSGSLDIKGNLNVSRRKQKTDFLSNLLIELAGNQYILFLKNTRLSGSIRGQIKLKGDIHDLEVTTDLETENNVYLGKGIHIDPFTVALSASGTYPVFRIDSVKTHIPEISFQTGERIFEFRDVAILGDEGEFNIKNQNWTFPGFHIDSSQQKDIILSVGYNKGKSILNIECENMNIIPFISQNRLIPSGWVMKGSDMLKWKGVLKSNRYFSLSSSLSLINLQFESPDDTILGDSISSDILFKCEADLEEPLIMIDSKFRIAQGELLYDRFYLDLQTNPISLELKAKNDLTWKDFHLTDSDLEIKDILRLSASGDLMDKGSTYLLNLSLDIPANSLKPIYQNFIQEPFEIEKPFLTNLDMNGELSARFDLSLDSQYRELKGILKLKNSDLLVNNKGISLTGVDLEFPFWYRSSGISVSGDPIPGRLSIENISIPAFPEQALSLTMEADPNHVDITTPISFMIPGGEMHLGPIEFKDIYSPSPSAKTSLHIDDLKIGPFLSILGLKDTNSLLTGKLDPVSMQGDEISGIGELKANIYNGEVMISNIGAAGVFTSSLLLKSDIKWNDLDLGMMTTGTAFGQIQGLLTGYMKDLEIAHGQPQKFDLLMETVPDKDIQQKISVKAVDNIARIGGGQSPFMGLAGSFATLFQEFPYEKIGIHASLENDVFKINGTIKEKGLEYIIKRKGFSGVNVVNQNPDNRISFKDMVKRIKRVTSSQQGPLIK